jgi:hypothetical protein
MIFSLLIIHNYDRISSTTRVQVLHTTTWDYFISHLPGRFRRSLKVMKEAIMTDINDFVQEFWRTSSDGVVGASFFALRRLFEILEGCSHILEGDSHILEENFFFFEVCSDIISVLATAVLADKNLQLSDQLLLDGSIRDKFRILFDAYRKMLDQLFSKSQDFGDILRFLPGVVVQKRLGMQGMADLYRIKPDILESLIESAIEPLRSSHDHYILDDYLSGFLQDRDRSQLYYCDPVLQHISICRHILSLLGGSDAIDFQSY